MIKEGEYISIKNNIYIANQDFDYDKITLNLNLNLCIHSFNDTVTYLILYGYIEQIIITQYID